VYASQGAIPGDLLYSLKVNIEELRLNTASEEGKSELYLQFASERVEEVKALIEEEKFDEIGVALKGFESRAAGVRQIMPETEMEDPLLVHFEVLNGLLDRVPYQAQEAIKHAITVSTWNKEIGETSRPEELPAGELPVELPVELPAVVPDTVPPVDVPPVEPPVVVPELPVEVPQEPVAPPVQPVEPPVDNTPVDPPVTPPAGRP
jgi:hypothetical protein